MKKIMTMAFALLLLAACGKSADEAYIDLVNEHTEALRNATGTDDLRAVMRDFDARNDAFLKEHGEDVEAWEKDPEMKKKVMGALEEMGKAFIQKTIELAKLPGDSVK